MTTVIDGTTGVNRISDGASMTGGMSGVASAKRFQANFSASAETDKYSFQSSTPNGNTILGALPNGTATVSGFRVYANSDPTNSPYGEIITDGLNVYVASSRAGSGTYLPLVFFTGGGERMRIGTNGNIGLWTTTAVSNPAGTNAFLALGDNDTGFGWVSDGNIKAYANGKARFQWTSGDGIAVYGDAEGGEVRFSNNSGSATPALIDYVTGSSRLRLVNGGNSALEVDSVGVTFIKELRIPLSGFSTTGDSVQLTQGGGGRAFSLAGAGNQITWFCGGNGVGSIYTNSTNTTYSTSSDYRLKDNIEDLNASGVFIDALRPRIWIWKSTGERGVGFIAHELQEISPMSVTGEKDAVNEDGEPIYQAVEYGSAEVIAMLVAEVKSLRARVAALEAA